MSNDAYLKKKNLPAIDEQTDRGRLHKKEACLRIYLLSPEEELAIYFFTLTIDGKEYSSGTQFSKRIYKQRKSILGHIEQFTKACLGKASGTDAEESEDATNSFNNVLNPILHEKDTPLNTLRSTIGSYIYSGLGLEGLFDRLLDKADKNEIDSLQILTDDFAIPWEWASRDGEKMLCEIMNVGKLYPKHIDTYDEKQKDRSTLNTVKDDDDLKDLKAKSRVLLVYDDMATSKETVNPLMNIGEEIETIKKCFEKDGFKPDQIRLINGQEEGECLDLALKQELHTNSQIKVIHLSGHIDSEGGFLHQDGKLTPEELHCLPQAKARLHESKPFIFLNCCSSGAAGNVYNEGFQLSTMFACLGASACLTTMGPILDSHASNFSQIFYNILLNGKGMSIGDVLRETRERFAQKYPGRPEAYFYSIIGKPDFELFPYFSTTAALDIQSPHIEDYENDEI